MLICVMNGQIMQTGHINMPNDLIQAPTTGQYPVTRNGTITTIGPGVNINGKLTGYLLVTIVRIMNQIF